MNKNSGKRIKISLYTVGTLFRKGSYLNKLGYCYTTRVYKEIGKYKVGQLYISQWGDVLKIDEVKTYWKVSDRPFYDEMNDDEKIEIRKYSEDIGLPYEFIKFSKV